MTGERMVQQPNTQTQSQDKRIRNFREVSIGYPKKIALDEGRRCPQCSDPVCMPGCPLGIDIPLFIRHIRENDPVRALETLREQNPFPGICGRICPAPCEKSCVFFVDGSPIGVRALERFASDSGEKRFKTSRPARRQGQKVAVVGSGPSGLTAAACLARLDYQVTVLESFARPGGVLRYGIPEFRLPDAVLDAEIQYLESLGVEIRTNVFFGRTVGFKDIFNEGYASVLLALGSGTPRFLDIPGTNLGGVYYSEEFLLKANLLRIRAAKSEGSLNVGTNVVILGKGNAAVDVARSCVRLGKKVTLLFEGTEDDLSVREEDRRQAKDEGVRFEIMVKPLEILAGGDPFVKGVQCTRMDFADPSEAGQWKLKAVPESEFTVEADTVFISAGHNPHEFIRKISDDLKLNRDGTIRIDKQGMTSLQDVFACGDAVTGADSVVGAMASGKKAAQDIHACISSRKK